MTSKSINISKKVQEYLQQKPPLTVIDLDELYRSVATSNPERDRARAALYHKAAGNPVSARNNPSAYYAIRLSITYSDTDSKDIFLSLPGIPRTRILQDIASSGTIETIISQLKHKYGAATINYWGNVAQYRTVTQARKGMDTAKGRDRGVCRLCDVVNKLRKDARLPSIKPKAIQASHIVSRRASFWTVLDSVEKAGYNIFSDDGVAHIKQGLKEDRFHNDEQFIITLCSEHDKLLLESLRKSALL